MCIAFASSSILPGVTISAALPATSGSDVSFDVTTGVPHAIASNTGSQLPHIVFTSPNLIFVVSTKKIVPTLADAMNRLMEYVVPLEDKHMKEKYGVGTTPNKIVTFNGENPMLGRKVRMILVDEDLGF